MFKKNYLLTTIFVISGLTACANQETTTTTPVTQAPVTQAPQPKPATKKLDIVKNRGKLICGVHGQLPGFSFVNEKGEYSGMDVDICRAIAAALFNDPAMVEYRNLSTQERFTALQSGEIDILSRNTTRTMSRETEVGLKFAPIIFYDGQGMMVPKASGITSLKQLNGKSICVQSGTTTEQNLADQMAKNAVQYTPVVFEDQDAMYAAYQQGRCQGATSDRSQLSSRRQIFSKPDDHIILDVILSKEPLAPAVLKSDPVWAATVTSIVHTLIEAEELGISSQNIDSFQNSQDPYIRGFLGLEGTLGEGAGLPNDFAARIIKQVGNYGEIYDRNIGKPLGLQRGPNQLWTKSGLLYSPPFR